IAKGKTIQMTNPTASVLLKKPYHPTVFSPVWMQAKRHLAGERWQHFCVAFFAPWYGFLIIVLRVCGLHSEYQKQVEDHSFSSLFSSHFPLIGIRSMMLTL